MLDFLDFEKRVTDKLYCNAWVATSIIGSSLIGSATQAYMANRASGRQSEAAQQGAAAQRAAAERAAGISLDMYDRTRGDLEVYRNLGTDATGIMRSKFSDLISPISVDPDALQDSDYYKFAMTQGQKAATNSAAARGLGSSGAAMKGAAAFAKGLATDTYKTAWEMENTNKKNAYDRLMGLINTGKDASTVGGALGEKAAYNAGQAYIGAGNATQAGLVGSANAEAAGMNAIGNAARGFSDDVGGYMTYRGLYGSRNSSSVNDPTQIGSRY